MSLLPALQRKSQQMENPPFAGAARHGQPCLPVMFGCRKVFWKEKIIMRHWGLPGDDGEVGRAHASSHEEHHILVPGLPVRHHLPLEGLQLVLIVPLNVDEADGHLPVPAPVKDLPEAALANELADLKLLEGDVPLLEEDAGLAGLAGEVAGREEREVHLFKVVLGLLHLLGAFLILWEGKGRRAQ